MRGYLSKSPASQSPKDDPMQIDKNDDSVNVSSLLGTFRQQSLVPCISISNANREYLVFLVIFCALVI